MSSFRDTLSTELERFARPLVRAAASPAELESFLRGLGWDLTSASQGVVDDLASRLDGVAQTAQTLLDSGGSGQLDPAALLELLESTADLFAELEAVLEALVALDTEQPLDPQQLAAELLGALTVLWLEEHHPAVHQVGRLFTVLATPAESDPVETVRLNDGAVVRWPIGIPRLRLENLPELIDDPVGLLRAAYLPDGLVDAAAVRAASDRIFAPVRDLVTVLGGSWSYGLHPAADLALDPETRELAETLLAIEFRFGHDAPSFGTLVWLSGADRGDLGVVFAPFGSLSAQKAFPGWTVILEVTPELDSFTLGPSGLVFPSSSPPIDAFAELAFLKHQTEAGKAFVLGSDTGSRLEIGELSVHVGAELSASGDYDFGISARAASSALVVAGGEADGFLSSFFPEEGLRADFDVQLAWSSSRGLRFEGAAALELEIPLLISIGPAVELHTLTLSLGAEGGGLRSSLGVTAGLDLGIVQAVVEDVGLAVDWDFPETGGNLGPLDLSLGFKPPSGLGLAVVAAGVVTGGGYLYFDPDEGEYAGAVQLEALGMGLAATGILVTKLEEGEGWSLIVTINVTLRGVQLGFGFTLDGVGGLLGIHRAMATEVLQAGLKDGTLDAFLYPDDPIGDAPLILSTLGDAFPATLDQYVFGPTLKIGWAGMLSAEVGVLFEIPDPIVVALVGQLEIGLPFLGSPLVELHMDTLGVVDLAAGELSIDVSLYDSQIVGFTLTGDVAIRFNWLGEPSFTLAVGGFNPAYPVPASFPKLERIAISLDTGGNPVIQLSGYFAVTSNSVQFGAHFDFYMKMVGFTIEAWAGFDVLVLFSPFQLRADLGVGATVKAGSITLLGVDLQFVLTGPQPWHAQGTAEFKLVGIKTEFKVDVTLPPHGAPEEIEPVDAGDLVLEAFSNEQNWSAALPEGEPGGVTFVEAYGATGVILHPSGRLEIRQKAVPLGEEIAKVGTAAVEGGNQFSIAAVEVVAEDGSTSELPESDWIPLDDWVAPGQFFEMSEDQKLEGPSFELMQTGISVGGGGLAAGAEVDAPFDYETGIIDPAVEKAENFQESSGTYRFELLDVDQITLAQTAGKGRKVAAAGAKAPLVAISEPVWAAASKDDLSAADVATTSTSRAGLLAAAGRSPEADSLQIVPAYEVKGA